MGDDPFIARGYADKTAEWEEPIIVPDVITREECTYLIDKAEPLFERSKVLAEKEYDAVRTSDTAYIHIDDTVAYKVIEKAASLAGVPVENCEELQVVRYFSGKEYRAHHDACCDDNEKCKEFEAYGGQRLGTLLLYLNDDFTEGQTHFPSDDLKLTAKPGSGIFFRPLGSKDKRCHPRALHAGLPPASGIKYACNIWVRESKVPRGSKRLWCRRMDTIVQAPPLKRFFCEGPDDPMNGPHVNASPQQKFEAKYEARERAYAWARQYGPLGLLIANQAILEIDECEDAVIIIDANGYWSSNTNYMPLTGRDTWKVDGFETPMFYTSERKWPPNTTAIVNSDVGDRINHKLTKIFSA